ncbi:MAG TPA: hypothetical protein VHJ20_17680 [Polyangia bacterium]|nr:hypothetical protein [Polyangia bacterium]
MLEPWIIEQIRRREEEERRRNERPQLEIPMGDERWRRRPDDDAEDERRRRQEEDEPEPEGGPRGVVIIDMRG